MRIERIQASPRKKGRVLVFLEDGACLKITEQELLDFGLRPGDELDDQRLGQLKAMEEAPRWQPALKDGEGVATDHVLRITLPEGRTLPREREIAI